jgi:hypothetical protein
VKLCASGRGRLRKWPFAALFHIANEDVVPPVCGA